MQRLTGWARRHRTRVVLAGKLLGSLALITWLIADAGLGHIVRTLGAAQGGWLALGFGLGVVAAFMQANQLRGLLLAFGVPTTYRRSLEIDTAARLFDAALPTNIGGDAVRVSLAVHTRRDASRAAVAVVLRRLMSVPGLVLLVGVGALASWHLPYSRTVRIIASFSALGALGLAIVLVGSTHLTSRRAHLMPSPVRKLLAAFSSVRTELSTDGHPLIRAGFRGFAFWVAVIASQTCFARSVQIDAPFEYMVAVVTAVNVLSLLPISIGGYGLRESIFGVLLGVHGVATTTQGATVGVCVSAQTLIFGLVGGIVYLAVRRQPTGTLAAEVPTDVVTTSSPKSTGTHLAGGATL